MWRRSCFIGLSTWVTTLNILPCQEINTSHSQTWPKNSHLKKLGFWFQHDLLELINGFKQPFIRGLGWTLEEVEKFQVEVKKNVIDRNIHAYQVMWVEVSLLSNISFDHRVHSEGEVSWQDAQTGRDRDEAWVERASFNLAGAQEFNSRRIYLYIYFNKDWWISLIDVPWLYYLLISPWYML
jgi:hypothetical protein